MPRSVSASRSPLSATLGRPRARFCRSADPARRGRVYARTGFLVRYGSCPVASSNAPHWRDVPDGKFAWSAA